ncbi:hypothetical protein [Microbacterium sp. 22296]|uniref:hypothetical protein n=1 Tax=Microbacterium sp. 22296 TaxID=3453903 RepID=UPI003F867694
MSSPTASILVEPFDAYLRRRARSDTAFAPGEAVTAAVALLRGCRESMGPSRGTRWWLRADGCPVAEEEEGAPDAIAATAETLERIATITDDDATRDLLTRARESVLTLPPREWDAVERRLFHHAVPVPLVLGPLTPVVETAPAPTRQAATGEPSRMLALVDADLADAVREVWHDVRRWWRGSPAVRFGTLCAAAAVIVASGLLVWTVRDASATSAPGSVVEQVVGEASPAGAPSPSATAAVAQTASVSPTPTASSAAPDDAASVPARPAEQSTATSGDLVGITRDVFAQIASCAGDAACVDAHEEGSGSPREPLLPGAETADIRLIDDFGGVIVVRLGVGSRLQYVTLVRQEDRWLVRTVRTVADQPS